MSVYHQKRNQSIEKCLPPLLEQLTLTDVQEAVKGRFNSFCLAIGIQALMMLMERDTEALAGPKGEHDPNRTAYRHGYLKQVFGDKVLIQRCQIHKERNVLGYLPEYKQEWVRRKLRKAWIPENAHEAVLHLKNLATALEHNYPDAAASLGEGLEETVTILKLAIPALIVQ